MFFYEFINSSLFPTPFYTIGIALLTVLIPIVIMIFSDEKDFIELDKNIIIDKLFNAKEKTKGSIIEK